MFVVTVLFRIHPGKEADFMTAMRENATRSFEDEIGCRQFDVARNDAGSEVYLYELYDDEAAFKVHGATPHFLAFDALVAPWVAEKHVARYQLVQGGPA